jgi:hypothetical protein
MQLLLVRRRGSPCTPASGGGVAAYIRARETERARGGPLIGRSSASKSSFVFISSVTQIGSGSNASPANQSRHGSILLAWLGFI